MNSGRGVVQCNPASAIPLGSRRSQELRYQCTPAEIRRARSFKRPDNLPVHPPKLQFVHINDLPPELLSQIFIYLPETAEEPFPFPIPESFHFWKVVTQVCQYWRTTALSTPSLWRTIQISKISDEAALQSLSLSGNLPLEVFYTADLTEEYFSESKGPIVDKALQMVVENAHRLRELHIFSSLTEACSPWKCFTKPTPLLEALTVISSDDEDDDFGTPYSLPSVFNAEMMSLKKVVLANVCQWPHETFRNLQHLALYDQLDEARLPLHTFLTTLSQSPQLETLILVGAGLEDDFLFDSSNLAQPVSLPHLKYLEVGDWSFEMVPLTFLKNITLPHDTTQCLWNLGWESNVRHLLFPRPEDHTLLQRCTKINITCFLDGEHTCEADTLVGVKGSTIYYYASSLPPGFGSMKSLGKFTNVTELNYCPDTRWIKYGDIFDVDLFMTLPKLKILRVSQAIASQLEKLCSLLIQFEPTPRRAAEQRRGSPSRSRAGSVVAGRAVEDRGQSLTSTHTPTQPKFRFAPLLEELHITHLNDHPDFTDRDFKPYTAEDLQPLILLANIRANNGLALKKLVIQGCQISHDPETHTDTPDLKPYFDEGVELIEKRSTNQYWEDSISEIWERGKVPRPPHPDW